MSRGDLTDTQWERLSPHLPKEKSGKRGRPYTDPRRSVNGILWVLRTGAPWRDMPERYGSWQTCYDRFLRWQRTGLWTRLLQTLQAEADKQSNVEWDGCAVESTRIKAHPHAAGAPRDPDEDATEPQKGGRQATRHNRLMRRRRVSTAKRWGAVAGD